jgi:hypothetical protein
MPSVTPKPGITLRRGVIVAVPLMVPFRYCV